MTDLTPKRERELMEVAAAALAWNRARLARIACEKLVPPTSEFSFRRMHALDVLSKACQAQARALRELRKACRIADPAALTINVQAAFTEPEPLTLEAPQ